MFVALLCALMPAPTILVGGDFDIALRCTRSADETGLIIIVCNHDLLQVYMVQRGVMRPLWHFLWKSEGYNAM